MDLSAIVKLLGRRPDNSDAATTLSGFKALVVSQLDLPANGSDLKEVFIRDRSAGFEARLAASGEIVDVFLLREGYQGFAGFPYSLVGELGLEASKSDIEAEFGTPDWSRPPRRIPLLGERGETLRYERDAYMLIFQFSAADGRLDQVTVSRR